MWWECEADIACDQKKANTKWNISKWKGAKHFWHFLRLSWYCYLICQKIRTFHFGKIKWWGIVSCGPCQQRLSAFTIKSISSLFIWNWRTTSQCSSEYLKQVGFYGKQQHFHSNRWTCFWKPFICTIWVEFTVR